MDLLDSAEEPHSISLSENQGGSAPLVFRLGGQLPPSPPGSYTPAYVLVSGSRVRVEGW